MNNINQQQPSTTTLVKNNESEKITDYILYVNGSNSLSKIDFDTVFENVISIEILRTRIERTERTIETYRNTPYLTTSSNIAIISYTKPELALAFYTITGYSLLPIVNQLSIYSEINLSQQVAVTLPYSYTYNYSNEFINTGRYLGLCLMKVNEKNYSYTSLQDEINANQLNYYNSITYTIDSTNNVVFIFADDQVVPNVIGFPSGEYTISQLVAVIIASFTYAGYTCTYNAQTGKFSVSHGTSDFTMFGPLPFFWTFGYYQFPYITNIPLYGEFNSNNYTMATSSLIANNDMDSIIIISDTNKIISLSVINSPTSISFLPFRLPVGTYTKTVFVSTLNTILSTATFLGVSVYCTLNASGFFETIVTNGPLPFLFNAETELMNSLGMSVSYYSTSYIPSIFQARSSSYTLLSNRNANKVPNCTLTYQTDLKRYQFSASHSFYLYSLEGYNVVGLGENQLYISYMNGSDNYYVDCNSVPNMDGSDIIFIQCDETYTHYPREQYTNLLSEVFLPSSQHIYLQDDHNKMPIIRQFTTPIKKLNRLTLNFLSTPDLRNYYNFNSRRWYMEIMIRAIDRLRIV